ncbi:MAG: hypothetical protein [Olavius algarvensis Gamma 1 endosymbiont]|nr:MAG: hypothetical protein [Olavius algarvensis Gamma 1 endosymbiont]
MKFINIRELSTGTSLLFIMWFTKVKPEREMTGYYNTK